MVINPIVGVYNGLYTHYKDFLLKVGGFPSPIWGVDSSLAHFALNESQLNFRAKPTFLPLATNPRNPRHVFAAQFAQAQREAKGQDSDYFASRFQQKNIDLVEKGRV